MAIYTGRIMISGAHNCNQRVGYTDCSAVWNTIGLKNTAITVSGINAGDDLFLVLGNTSTTAPNFRTWINDDISTNIFAASPKQQPSLTPSIVIGATGVIALPLWVSWQGN